MTAPSNTSEKIMAAIHQLSEADRLRVLKFALAILSDRQGKQMKRRSRFQQSEINDWRINS